MIQTNFYSAFSKIENELTLLSEASRLTTGDAKHLKLAASEEASLILFTVDCSMDAASSEAGVASDAVSEAASDATVSSPDEIDVGSDAVTLLNSIE